jgi:hypothetical protein
MKLLTRTLLVVAALSVASVAQAQQLRPLSAADKARVDSLLQAFDPNSYHFTYQYTDAQGQVQTARVGQARGLASLRQTNTVRRVPPGAAAGTNNTINIFKEFAGTNNTINIFREFAGTNNTINIFREAGLNDRARSLNVLLQQYYAPQGEQLRVNRPTQMQAPAVQRPVQPAQTPRQR